MRLSVLTLFNTLYGFSIADATANHLLHQVSGISTYTASQNTFPASSSIALLRLSTPCPRYGATITRRIVTKTIYRTTIKFIGTWIVTASLNNTINSTYVRGRPVTSTTTPWKSVTVSEGIWYIPNDGTTFSDISSTDWTWPFLCPSTNAQSPCDRQLVGSSSYDALSPPVSTSGYFSSLANSVSFSATGLITEPPDMAHQAMGIYGRTSQMTRHLRTETDLDESTKTNSPTGGMGRRFASSSGGGNATILPEASSSSDILTSTYEVSGVPTITLPGLVFVDFCKILPPSPIYGNRSMSYAGWNVATKSTLVPVPTLSASTIRNHTTPTITERTTSFITSSAITTKSWPSCQPWISSLPTQRTTLSSRTTSISILSRPVTSLTYINSNFDPILSYLSFQPHESVITFWSSSTSDPLAPAPPTDATPVTESAIAVESSLPVTTPSIATLTMDAEIHQVTPRNAGKRLGINWPHWWKGDRNGLLGRSSKRPSSIGKREITMWWGPLPSSTSSTSLTPSEARPGASFATTQASSLTSILTPIYTTPPVIGTLSLGSGVLSCAYIATTTISPTGSDTAFTTKVYTAWADCSDIPSSRITGSPAMSTKAVTQSSGPTTTLSASESGQTWDPSCSTVVATLTAPMVGGATDYATEIITETVNGCWESAMSAMTPSAESTSSSEAKATANGVPPLVSARYIEIVGWLLAGLTGLDGIREFARGFWMGGL